MDGLQLGLAPPRGAPPWETATRGPRKDEEKRVAGVAQQGPAPPQPPRCEIELTWPRGPPRGDLLLESPRLARCSARRGKVSPETPNSAAPQGSGLGARGSVASRAAPAPRVPSGGTGTAVSGEEQRKRPSRKPRLRPRNGGRPHAERRGVGGRRLEAPRSSRGSERAERTLARASGVQSSRAVGHTAAHTAGGPRAGSASPSAPPGVLPAPWTCGAPAVPRAPRPALPPSGLSAQTKTLLP